MMILTGDGFIYKAVPNIVQKKDARGNRYSVREGLKPDGIPLMKVVMFSAGRVNPAVQALESTGLLISQE